MLIYEVKLLHPETQEILFQSQGARPQLPTSQILQQYPGAILIINTRDFVKENLDVNKRVA